MSGVIDPLLIKDPPRERAETTSDVTALLRQQRPRLVRLAAAIALDRRLAIEIVDRATTDLQRHIASVDDPARELERTVVQRATARAGRSRIDRSRQGRRRVASTRPAPVSPVFDRSDRAAVWYALTTLEPRQRALVVLADWPTGWHGRRGCEQLADVTGWPRRAVSSLLDEGIRRIEAVAPDPAAADAQVADALAAAMAQLGEVSEEPPGHEVAVRALDAGVPATAARRLARPAEPHGRRARSWAWAWALAALVLVAGSVAAVWSVSDGGATRQTDETGSAPADERLIRPQWFEMLRPLVPERFDRLALVAHDPEEIAFLAADTTTGRTLDIHVDRREWQPVAFAPRSRGDADAVDGLAAEPRRVTTIEGGVRVVRGDGAAVQVTCELCDLTGPDTAARPPDVGAIADAVAAGFALEDIGSGFGAPDTTAESIVALAAARTSLASVEPIEPVEPVGALGVGGDGTPASGLEPVVRVRAIDEDIQVLIVRGLVPVPAEGVRPRAMVVDGGRIGWILSADGVGVRVTVADPTGRRGADALDELLDAVEAGWARTG